MDKLQSCQVSDQPADLILLEPQPSLSAGQMAEVMDTSVAKVRSQLSKFKGATKTSSGHWMVPAETLHGFLNYFHPEHQPHNPADLVFTWFAVVAQIGFPEEIPTEEWLADKHRLIDALSGCSCGRT